MRALYDAKYETSSSAVSGWPKASVRCDRRRIPGISPHLDTPYLQVSRSCWYSTTTGRITTSQTRWRSRIWSMSCSRLPQAGVAFTTLGKHSSSSHTVTRRRFYRSEICDAPTVTEYDWSCCWGGRCRNPLHRFDCAGLFGDAFEVNEVWDDFPAAMEDYICSQIATNPDHAILFERTARWIADRQDALRQECTAPFCSMAISNRSNSAGETTIDCSFWIGNSLMPVPV